MLMGADPAHPQPNVLPQQQKMPGAAGGMGGGAFASGFGPGQSPLTRPQMGGAAPGPANGAFARLASMQGGR
jgi:hypothetical protein